MKDNEAMPLNYQRKLFSGYLAEVSINCANHVLSKTEAFIAGNFPDSPSSFSQARYQELNLPYILSKEAFAGCA